jgi:hypothetical protein
VCVRSSKWRAHTISSHLPGDKAIEFLIAVEASWVPGRRAPHWADVSALRMLAGEYINLYINWPGFRCIPVDLWGSRAGNSDSEWTIVDARERLRGDLKVCESGVRYVSLTAVLCRARFKSGGSRPEASATCRVRLHRRLSKCLSIRTGFLVARPAPLFFEERPGINECIIPKSISIPCWLRRWHSVIGFGNRTRHAAS